MDQTIHLSYICTLKLWLRQSQTCVILDKKFNKSKSFMLSEVTDSGWTQLSLQSVHRVPGLFDLNQWFQQMICCQKAIFFIGTFFCLILANRIVHHLQLNILTNRQKLVWCFAFVSWLVEATQLKPDLGPMYFCVVCVTILPPRNYCYTNTAMKMALVADMALHHYSLTVAQTSA